MKGKLRYKVEGRTVEREVNYIPVRFILAIALAVLETVTIVAIVIAMSWYVPYFYLMVWATEISCVIRIIASEDNPDYKIPWLLVVLIVPVAGFMLYFLFYDRKLHKRYIKRLAALKALGAKPDDSALFEKLIQESPAAHSQARMLCSIGETHLYSGTKQEYFPLGCESIVKKLRKAGKSHRRIDMQQQTLQGADMGSILNFRLSIQPIKVYFNRLPNAADVGRSCIR